MVHRRSSGRQTTIDVDREPRTNDQGLRLIGRRAFLSESTKAAGALAFAPAVLRQEQNRPSITHGTSSGDVSGNRAIVWARCDRAARMLVEWSTTESFATIQR